ncbi:MAG: hypothetical protein LBB18_00090 [Puniceicoccales bacterium]|nr:hypothetical protein [Puniceicoccales bacterium]
MFKLFNINFKLLKDFAEMTSVSIGTARDLSDKNHFQFPVRSLKIG